MIESPLHHEFGPLHEVVGAKCVEAVQAANRMLGAVAAHPLRPRKQGFTCNPPVL